ncbi:MAG: hypothetical protein GTO14_20370 [Anaerolineales bacterium]|nr:hypothetical protein [Anaerolineales bacterium]
MTNRLGLAFILIGVLVMLVFVISASNQQGDMITLLAGAILCIIGLWLRRKSTRAERRASRFQLLRRFQGAEEEEIGEV